MPLGSPLNIHPRLKPLALERQHQLPSLRRTTDESWKKGPRYPYTYSSSRESSPDLPSPESSPRYTYDRSSSSEGPPSAVSPNSRPRYPYEHPHDDARPTIGCHNTRPRHVVPSYGDETREMDSPEPTSPQRRSFALTPAFPASQPLRPAPQIPPDIPAAQFPDASEYLRSQLRMPPGLPVNLWSIEDPPSGEKPSYPLPVLVKLAIHGSARQKLTLQEIYQALEDRFVWFRMHRKDQAWKNSIRHNLSLNKVFRNTPRPITEPGKGSYWELDVSKGEGNKRLRKRRKKQKEIANEDDESDYHPCASDDSSSTPAYATPAPEEKASFKLRYVDEARDSECPKGSGRHRRSTVSDTRHSPYPFPSSPPLTPSPNVSPSYSRFRAFPDAPTGHSRFHSLSSINTTPLPTWLPPHPSPSHRPSQRVSVQPELKHNASIHDRPAPRSIPSRVTHEQQSKEDSSPFAYRRAVFRELIDEGKSRSSS